MNEIIDQWTLDMFSDPEFALLAQKKFQWLNGIDPTLTRNAVITKTRRGYFLVWAHRHPEKVYFDEWTADLYESEPEKARLSTGELHEEYKAAFDGTAMLEEPEFSKRLSRDEAWRTIAFCYLPEEWHREAAI
jgi:hypothetical protein